MKKYLLTESLVNTAALYLILKKLMTPFEDWDAYKLGIINKNGEKLKQPITSKERDVWDLLTRFCCNFKRILQKLIGPSNIMTYFTAAYLLKDSLSYFYITHNETLLQESLNDLTITKQQKLHQIITCIESKYGKEKVNEANFEILMFKYSKILKDINVEDII